MALTNPFAAVPAHADLDTITLTRAGANKTTLSVSTTDTVVSVRFGEIYFKLGASASDCTGWSGIGYTHRVFPFIDGLATYSRTITGNAGKYICLRGSVYALGTSTWHSAVAAPPTYPGPTLTLNSAGADKEYENGDHVDVTAGSTAVTPANVPLN